MCAVLVAGSSHVYLHCLFIDKRKMELCYKCTWQLLQPALTWRLSAAESECKLAELLEKAPQ